MVAFPAYQRFAESTAASPLPFCVEHLGDLKLFLAIGIPNRRRLAVVYYLAWEWVFSCSPE